VNKLAQPVGN
jgi:hypothetical protein